MDDTEDGSLCSEFYWCSTLSWLLFFCVGQGLRAEFLAVLLPQVPHSFSAQTVAERTLVSAESLDVAQVGVFVRHLDALTRGLKLKTVIFQPLISWHSSYRIKIKS